MKVLFAWSIVCALSVAASGQEPCVRTSGFIPLSNLTVLAQEANNNIFQCNTVCLRSLQQRLIPQISFTCSGTITKWTFAANFDNEFLGTPLTEYPELQLWRLDDGETNMYTKVGSCTTSNVAEANPDRMYECIPSSPLPFQVGDVLGIFQPSSSRLTVYYDVRVGPLNYFDFFGLTPTPSFSSFDITGADAQTETALPLVTVEILVDCGSLTEPENGQVTLTGTTEGSTATYSCNTGYSLMGVSMRTCQSDGTWSDQPPVCTPVDCGSLTEPENGQVTLTGTTEGSTANYSCNIGYSLMGVSMRTCQSDGIWSDQPPVCTLVDCGSLTDPENGQVTLTGTTEGSTANYSCNTGYSLMGVSMRTCQSDGMWSDQPPVCTRNSVTPSPVVPSTPVIPSSSMSEAISTPDNIPTSTSQFVEGSSGEPPSPTTSVPPMSETPTPQDPPTDDPTDIMIPPQENSTASVPPGGNNGTSSTYVIIVGAVIGGLIAFLLALTVIVLVLILRRRRGRKDIFRTTAGVGTTGHTIGVENPMYRGCTADEMPEQLKECEIRQGAANYYDDVDMSCSGIYQYIDDQPGQYEEPVMLNKTSKQEVPTERKNAINSKATSSRFPNSESPHTRAKIYEWGVYVPSEEERKAIATGDGRTISEVSEHAYAVLGEAQFKTGYVYMASAPNPAFFEDSDIYWKPSSDKSELYEQLAKRKYREIPRHQVQITDNLGEGQFGTVSKGIWQSPAGAKEVAVKTLKSQASETDAVKFLQEAAINGQFKHPNIVTLLGVVTLGKPVMIVLELLANGDLRHYLNKQQPAPGELVPSGMSQILLNFCQQVAAGMDYLAGKAFVHRDLAARNILVSEDKTCKVSDFGMSRDLEDEDYYVSHGGKIPVKWTAPEALHYKKYSTASDVWSFGVVMYEIWSLGHKPFEGHTNTQSIKLIDTGYRLPPPPGCPKEIYKWMIRCWHPERHTRPQFSQLSEALNQPDFDLLTWSEEDAGVHPQAMVLGAPLEAGKQLYPELQNMYIM